MKNIDSYVQMNLSPVDWSILTRNKGSVIVKNVGIAFSVERIRKKGSFNGDVMHQSLGSLKLLGLQSMRKVLEAAMYNIDLFFIICCVRIK